MKRWSVPALLRLLPAPFGIFVGRMLLKAIHAAEDRPAAGDKARAVVAKLKAQKLAGAAKQIQARIEQTVSDYEFAGVHRRRIRTSTLLVRLFVCEVGRPARVLGAVPDGNSAPMRAAPYLWDPVGNEDASGHEKVD